MVAPMLLDPPQITVRFRRNSEPVYGPGATAEIAARQDADWAALEALFPGVQLQPLTGSLPKTTLQGLIDRGRRLTPGYVPARFFALFRVELPPKAGWLPHVAAARDLAGQLRALMFQHLPVDRVTVELAAAPLAVSDGPVTATTPELRHLRAAPEGVGVEAVWNVAAGTGQGEGEVFADIERGWKTDHVEFTGMGFTVLTGGVQVDDDVPHGTQVLGVIAARRNGKYGLGVAPLAAHAVLASEWSAAGAPRTEQALAETIVALSAHPPGSVLLLEVQKSASAFLGSGFPAGLLGPCEMHPIVFEYIQLAVANHICVVEAAGNGGVGGLNLDDHPGLLHGDSGAILVGQSVWVPPSGGTAGHHIAVPGGCTGNRLDCFGWGDKVYTSSALPDGIVGGKQQFKDFATSGFNGTSAAAAMIAGVALVVQGLRRALPAVGGYLPPMQLRALLAERTPGVHTPLQGGVTHVIGVMPNLQSVGATLGVLPDLYIRDNVGDTGGPHNGALSSSPDIIVRTTALGTTPDAAFGEGSGTEGDIALSEQPVAGGSAEVYVRVRNRGGTDVAGAKVTVSYARSGTLLLPSQWTPIGSALVDVPDGDTLVVAGPIPWNVVPGAGHYCFIATVEHAADRLFTPATFALLEDFKAYIRIENNVAWRNFNVVAAAANGTVEPLFANVAGADEGEEQEMELRVEARLPRSARLEVEFAEELSARMSLPEAVFKRDKLSGLLRGRLPASGRTGLGLLRLPRRALHRVTLHVRLPAAKRNAVHEVALVQLHQGQELGRVTWRIVPGKGSR